MIPVITSFVPLTHTHLYLPALFKIWEAFNSSVIDDRMIDFAGDISEENMFNESGEEGGAEWKDVGIWTNEQWTILIGKGLGSMSKRPSLHIFVIHLIDLCQTSLSVHPELVSHAINQWR